MCLAATVMMLQVSGNAFAQEGKDLPLIFEVRATFTPSNDPDKSFEFKPSLGLQTDGLWKRFDLGVAYTSGGLTAVDTSGSLEALIIVEIAKWYSADSSRSFTLQSNIGLDVIQSNMSGRRIYALGGVFDGGLVSNMAVGLRATWVNQDKAFDDWSIQTFFQFDMK